MFLLPHRGFNISFHGGCRLCNRQLCPEREPLGESQTRACSHAKQTAVRAVIGSDRPRITNCLEETLTLEVKILGGLKL